MKFHYIKLFLLLIFNGIFKIISMGIKNLVSKEYYILFKLQIFGGFFLLILINEC